MKIEFETIEEIEARFDKLGMGKGTPIMDFLMNKVVPVYEPVQAKLGNKDFFYRTLKSCYDVLTNSDFISYVGFMKEIVLAATFINLHYTLSKKSNKILGFVSASRVLAENMFAKDLERFIKDPNLVYQFLSEVHTANSSIRTLTMSGRNDYRYPALVHDIWLVTITDPDYFCPQWYHDYKLDYRIKDETLLFENSWRKAKNLFGKNGIHGKILTPFVAQSNFFSTRLGETQEILADKELYKIAILNSPE